MSFVYSVPHFLFVLRKINALLPNFKIAYKVISHYYSITSVSDRITGLGNKARVPVFNNPEQTNVVP